MIISCVETITTRRGTHTIYTREEADAAGIAYKPWYEVQTEEWGLTDDGFVLQCLYAGEMRMSKNGARGRYLRFSGGRCWTREGRKRYPFEWLKRKESYARWSVSGQSWDAKESKKTRTKNVVRAMATYIASGSAPDWKKLGDIYRKDQQIPEATVRRLFKSEVIQGMLDKELSGILVRQGLTKEYVIKNMKAVVELALASNDLTNMRLQLKDIGEILEVFPKKGPEFDPTREIPAVEQLPELDMSEDERRMLEARNDIGTE